MVWSGDYHRPPMTRSRTTRVARTAACAVGCPPARGLSDVVRGSNQRNRNPDGDDPRWITRNFALQPTP